MKKVRSLFLLLIPVLMIVPQVWSHANNRDARLGTKGDQMRLIGNVKVRSTTSGHVTVAVDGSVSSLAHVDGLTDFTWHFVPKKNRPEYHNIAMDLEAVTVLFTSRRVTVMSGDNVLLNLSLEKAPKGEMDNPYYIDRRRDVADTTRIHKGIALVRTVGDSEQAEGLWKCGEEGGRCGVKMPSSGPSANDDWDLIAGGCPSGGQGSSGCSISNCCSVDCNAGYYACCHCTDGCRCIKSSGGSD